MTLRIAIALSLLLTSWHGFAEIGEIDFSADETRFLQEHPVLRVGVGTAFPPYQYVDQDNGKYRFKGIVSDYIEKLGQILGVKFEPVYGITFKQALELGKKQQIDLFAAVSDTPERRRFLNFTDTYLTSPLVIITRSDAGYVGSIGDLKSKRIAIIRHLANYSKLKNVYPGLTDKYVFLDSVIDVLRAVSTGKADACISNLAVATYLINKHALPNLKVAAPTNWDNNDLSMGVRKDWPILVGILNKSLKFLGEEYGAEINSKWISIDYSPMISPWMVKNVIVPLVLISFGFVLVFLYWNRRLNKVIELKNITEGRLKYLSTHDTLTGLLNRKELYELLNHDISQSLRYDTPLSVMMIDVDFFKKINDRYGHLTGDRVLQTVASILKGLGRESDYVSRFGGEEFVFVLPQTNLENAQKFAELVRQKISGSSFFSGDSRLSAVTVSIGVSELSEQLSTLDRLIDCADQALYRAKVSGRNQVKVCWQDINDFRIPGHGV